MKILVDTNILVSAVLRDRDPEKVILYLIEQPDIEWVVSSEIISEYKSVLGRDKFQLPHDLLQSWYKVLDDVTTPYSVTNTFDFPRDQKDAKFLACAHS